jgi:hypothetical protein
MAKSVRSSRFNLKTPYESTGEILFFNTLTGAFSAVDVETSDRIEALLANPDRSAEDPELVDYLLQQGFLVEDAVNVIATD